MGKKALCLIFAFLLSIESFASIVSDNDGSAFVTKAEFEALKRDFNKEIENYNTSIAEKIDGAIAAYLAGLKLSTKEKVNLLFQFDASSTNKAVCVEDGHNTIAKQTFQGGTYLNSLFTDYGINWMARFGVSPVGPPDNRWNDSSLPYSFNSGGGWNWTWLSLLGRSYYDQMEGYAFRNDDNEIIKNKYGYDNCNLNLSMTSSANQNYGQGGLGDRFELGARFGVFDGKYINRSYANVNGIGLGQGDANSWAGGTNQVLLAADITPALAKSWWCDQLPIPNSFATRLPLRNNSAGYPELTVNSIFRVSHTTKNEDKTIYTYTKCHDVIYAHNENAEVLEEYVDYMDKINASTDKDALTIGGTKTNLFLTDVTEKWAWAHAPFDTTRGTPWFVADKTTTDTRWIIGPRRNWRFTPKFKLKNDSTIVPPNTASESGGTTYWNTLNQFKNGYLEFKDYNGNVVYPKFYGGLPLISFGNQNIEKFTFDLQIRPTTTTGTIPTEVCIQMKKSQFPNENVISSFPASDLADLVSFTGKVGNTVYRYDETNHYLKVPLNTKVNIELELPQKNTTYFLRWWESGNTSISGGEIVELNNGMTEY